MDVKTTYEVELELAMGEDEDLKPKDRCVKNCMDRVTEALSGKNYRSMLGAIEGQIRAAYNDGYSEALKIAGEFDTTADVWRMIQTVANWDCDEVNAAFGTGEFLSDAITKYTLNEFQSLYKAYESAKRCDFCIGDEVMGRELSQPNGFPLRGWVIATTPGITILDSRGEMIALDTKTCSKTGKHSKYFELVQNGKKGE